MTRADVSPPQASVVLPGGLDVPAALAWPEAPVPAVWVGAKPRPSAAGLVVWVQSTLLALPVALAVAAVLESHWAALAPVAQTPQETPRAVDAAPCCNALVIESLGA